MSGFAGVIRLDGAPVEKQMLQRLAVGLRATAIEAPRFWQAGPARVVFRHRGALPQDVHDIQPRPFAGGNATLVFDGRIDDRADLAGRLGRPLDPDLADAAWVTAACERWGAAAAEHFIGDFAFAWWDARAHA